jgi:hypothetical protein
MRLLIVVLILISSTHAIAQRFADGTLISKTAEPIPYVNVYLKSNRASGTITNVEGSFRLRLSDNPADSIVFSHIGFKRKAVSTKFFATPKTIELDEQERMLSEIIVMPDSTLVDLLRKAFSKIKDNYPVGGTLLEGFYRETDHVEEGNKLLTFAESTIQFYKPGYRNKQYGPVRIVKGGKSEIEAMTNYSNMFFYGGLYCPQRYDFVKEQFSFIDPEFFRMYKYSIEDVSNDGDSEVMLIAFEPRSKSKASYKGKFFLDKKTLAYIGCSWELTDYGLKDYGIVNIHRITHTRRTVNVRYRKFNDKWHIDFVTSDATWFNPKYNTHIRSTAEYVTTSLEAVNSNPIKDSESVPYSAVYTQQDTRFTPDYWKDTVIIARDSALAKQVSLLFKNNDLNIENKHRARKGPEFADLVNISSKFRASFALNVIPINLSSGLWTAGYGRLVSTTTNISEATYTYALGSEMSYRFNRAFSGFINTIDDHSSVRRVKMERIGVNYHKLISGWRKPFTLQIGVSLASSSVKQEVGNVHSSEAFEINGVSFSGRDIKLLVGTKGFGVVPDVQLNYGLSPRLMLNFGVGSYVSFMSTGKIYFEQKKNIFKTKLAGVSLDDPNVIFRVNGSESSNGLSIRDRQLFGHVGIAVGIN